MNAAAVEVVKELPELIIAYGVSDEFRYVRLIAAAFLYMESRVSLIRRQLRLP